MIIDHEIFARNCKNPTMCCGIAVLEGAFPYRTVWENAFVV